MESLKHKLTILKARLKAQQMFCMNTQVQVASEITKAEIKAVEKILKNEDSDTISILVDAINGLLNCGASEIDIKLARADAFLAVKKATE